VPRAIGRACCRVDLAGGTLDIWPLGLLHPGARTVNLAIDIEVAVAVETGGGRCRIEGAHGARQAATWEELGADPEVGLFALLAAELGLSPATIGIESDSPRGGGLGASSALGVAFLAAAEAVLGSVPSPTDRRASLVRDVEARLMALPTGKQDQYAALLGGALEVRHRAGGEEVRRLAVDLVALGDSLLVAYTGSSHFSAANNWEVVRRRLDGDPESVALFEGIVEAASHVVVALERSDLAAVGRWMSHEWSHRRRLARAVATPTIETLLERAIAAGAWGGKACGAGGGGCIAVLAPAVAREEVAARLREAGGEVLPARPSAHGVRVELGP
jgi:D-glycero-alpha-D-manno-heptose-7-phosphate kinase